MHWTLRLALVSPDGVAPCRIVCVSASVNLPLHHKVQKFSSGTGSPGWSREKGRVKHCVCVCVCVCVRIENWTWPSVPWRMSIILDTYFYLEVYFSLIIAIVIFLQIGCVIQGRSQIFKVHARSMSVDRDIRWELLARMCPNCTGMLRSSSDVVMTLWWCRNVCY